MLQYLRHLRLLAYRFFAPILLLIGTVAAQNIVYHQTNLASDLSETANVLSPALVNPWGIAFLPGGPLFIADAGRVTAHNADGSGAASGFRVATLESTGPDRPTGIVSDPTGSFFIGGLAVQFIVVTASGTIAGWGPDNNGNLPVQATVTVDHSARGDVYTGSAVLSPACCTVFLAVADFHGGAIRSFTRGFAGLQPPGTFTDPDLPPGFAPFGIQLIGEQVFVTYALQDAGLRTPVAGIANGIVSVFDQTGNFVRRFATGGTLNAPWGVTQASAHFGTFSNDILVGNFGDGSISAFDPITGNFVGQLTDATGNIIRNSGLLGITFRSDGFGDPDTLYFTAAIANQQHGLLGALTATINSLPTSGWWWNPAEPGRGFFIERNSAGRIFMTAFLYADNGRATWVLSTGPMSGATYTGALDTYGNGQTLTGPYKPNTQTGTVGSVSITFADSFHGTLTAPGGTIPIERFGFTAKPLPATPGAVETGWWFNRDEPGRGFAIEVQNGSVFIGGFLYDDAGNPIWQIASGALSSPMSYSGQWVQYGGGQTLTGGFKTNSLVDGDIGTLAIQFSDATNATLTLPDGRKIPITRFGF